MDAELAYKVDHSSEEVRVDVGLVVGKCRVGGATVRQRNGHTFSGPKAPPKVWPVAKVVRARVQKRSV